MGGLVEASGGCPLGIVEVGCAHAKLFDVLDPLFPTECTGIKLDYESARALRSDWGRPRFTVVNDAAQSILRDLGRPCLVVAVETVEHIPGRQVVKNVGLLLIRYKRTERFDWFALKQIFWVGLYQVNRLPLYDMGHAGFDWRWLGQTIRHNTRIRKIRTPPLGLLLAGFTTDVMFLTEPRELVKEVEA